MSALLAAATPILAAPGLARARCKFEQDEAGLERGKRYTVSAKMTSYVRFEFWRKSDDFFVNAIVGTIMSGIDANVDQQSPLVLRLASGDSIELEPFTESETRRTFFGFGVNRKISGGIYRLPAAVARTLTDIDVTGIEFRYKDEGALSSRSWETRRGDRKNIRKGSACLFEPVAGSGDKA